MKTGGYLSVSDYLLRFIQVFLRSKHLAVKDLIALYPRILDGDTEFHSEKAFIGLLPEPFVSFSFKPSGILHTFEKVIVTVSATLLKKMPWRAFSVQS